MAREAARRRRGVRARPRRGRRASSRTASWPWPRPRPRPRRSAPRPWPTPFWSWREASGSAEVAADVVARTSAAALARPVSSIDKASPAVPVAEEVEKTPAPPPPAAQPAPSIRVVFSAERSTGGGFWVTTAAHYCRSATPPRSGGRARPGTVRPDPPLPLALALRLPVLQRPERVGPLSSLGGTGAAEPGRGLLEAEEGSTPCRRYVIDRRSPVGFQSGGAARFAGHSNPCV